MRERRPSSKGGRELPAVRRVIARHGKRHEAFLRVAEPVGGPGRPDGVRLAGRVVWTQYWAGILLPRYSVGRTATIIPEPETPSPFVASTEPLRVKVEVIPSQSRSPIAVAVKLLLPSVVFGLLATVYEYR